MTTDASNEAERELKSALVEALKLVDRQPLGGTRVASIDSYGLCEDGQTVSMMVELVDGRIACIQACPGEAITSQVVGGGESKTEVDFAGTDEHPNVCEIESSVRGLTTCP